MHLLRWERGIGGGENMLTIFIIEDDHNFLVNTINGINMSKDFKIVGTLQKYT